MEGSSLTWNWNFFGATGYLGVALALAVLLLWAFYFVFKGKPIICQIAFVIAVAAFGLAKINSLTYVNKIQLDPAAQKAAFEAQQAAKRKALLESRGEEVAQIRFAEDGQGDFLDRAGMDETDLKYFESQLSGEQGETPEEGAEPDWKGEKKTRTGGDQTNELGSEVLEAAEAEEPILMPEAEMMMANKLDAWVLKITMWLIFIGGGFVLLDHLKRANRYGESYLPLPLPSALLNSLHRYPPVVVRPEVPRRTMPEELAWFLKRGDSFIYLNDDANVVDQVSKEFEPLTNRKIKPAEILFAESKENELSFSDEFAFEVWWFGRASVVVTDASRARSLVQEILTLLERRKDSRAAVHQTAHLIWDLKEPMPKDWLQDFERLAKRTGVSLFLCNADMSLPEGGSTRSPIYEAPQLV